MTAVSRHIEGQTTTDLATACLMREALAPAYRCGASAPGLPQTEMLAVSACDRYTRNSPDVPSMCRHRRESGAGSWGATTSQSTPSGTASVDGTKVTTCCKREPKKG